MKKINIITIILLSAFLLGCQSVQKALTPQKKGGGDEFLVEKKSPLVMPPSYKELPKPKSAIEQNDINSAEVDIKSIILNKESEINANSEKSDTKSSIEDSVLKKISN